ncbi:phosphoribosylglycinamide formyltransferase [Helicobacter himalayensis]|uniref:phosphoribosylglycinamide formyltransferase n=1 Tax=Helicobacter himalayensis TaxID=1591088 RepID=UPI0009ECCACE|nr:phosphoribosylglycinamide formyltransferase [Helicobacter himalayensis]
MSQNTLRLVVLFSGNGTNMLNLIDKLHNKVFLDSQNVARRICISVCFCNNPHAKGIERVRGCGIECVIIPSKGKAREEFDKELVTQIKAFKPNLCVLSGFMRILTPHFTAHLKALNIHPSFLPLHKGAHAIEQSFESNEDFGGVSVHWVSEELDSGEIILQEKLPKISGESLAEFEKRIHKLEYELFPKAILHALGLRPN